MVKVIIIKGTEENIIKIILNIVIAFKTIYPKCYKELSTLNNYWKISQSFIKKLTSIIDRTTILLTNIQYLLITINKSIYLNTYCRKHSLQCLLKSHSTSTIQI